MGRDRRERSVTQRGRSRAGEAERLLGELDRRRSDEQRSDAGGEQAPKRRFVQDRTGWPEDLLHHLGPDERRRHLPAALELHDDVPAEPAAVERGDLGRGEGEGGDLHVRRGGDGTEVLERLSGERGSALTGGDPSCLAAYGDLVPLPHPAELRQQHRRHGDVDRCRRGIRRELEQRADLAVQPAARAERDLEGRIGEGAVRREHDRVSEHERP
jgi:hypothetical protein